MTLKITLDILRMCAARAVVAAVAVAASCCAHAAEANVDSLLKVLDHVIDNRSVYLAAHEKHLADLKDERRTLRSEREVFDLNMQIYSAYESFVCDSAMHYLQENLAIGGRLRDSVLIKDVILRMALIEAKRGQFLQARDYFNSVNYNTLPGHLKALYGWSQLKYLGNMILSTDEAELQKQYRGELIGWRDSLINMFGVDSDLYRKEIAGRYNEMGNYKDALAIFLDLFKTEKPDTHDYAMMSKGLADIYRHIGDMEQYKRYLLLSAIADTRQAIKENESLLSLAEQLYSEGDVNRAYRYMRAALEDANFYNSRFKNAQIARIYPLVEISYIEMLNEQQRRLHLYLWCMALLSVIIGVVALLTYKQTRAVSRSRSELAKAKERLERASGKLAEANLIRERYVGYFMHQCSLNVNKLDEFRRNVNRKIKANQIDELYVLSSRPLEKELEELYLNFDKAFLNLYPNFIEEFNSLLQPDNRFTPAKGRLNTPLRIFALIRLGITDMTQIANFLHYSVQTVYNYKSKVRKISLLTPEAFEEMVKKIGALAPSEN